MKLTKKYLKKLINEEFRLLVEQEEEADMADTEEATEEDAEETPGDEEGPEAEVEAEAEEAQIEPGVDEVEPLGKSVDDELNALFVDFETDAINAAKGQAQNEANKYSIVRVLYEQEEIPVIDMETFAGDVARLAKNYDSLLDMKALIVKKAEDYITDKYGPEQAAAMLDILDLRYDISLDIPQDLVDPMGVGASPIAAEGGI
tara:strand:+ start:22727 stop:23335 length:609 start_codon:yes stop_codon:yes gene_type:complete